MAWVEVWPGAVSDGLLPEWNGLSRLATRFLADPARAKAVVAAGREGPIDAERANQLGLATVFADELLAIAERHRVPGRCVVHGLAGRLSRNATGDGLVERVRRIAVRNDDAVVWMLDDSYSYVHAMPWRFLSRWAMWKIALEATLMESSTSRRIWPRSSGVGLAAN